VLTIVLGILLLIVLLLAASNDDGPGSPRPVLIPVRSHRSRR
jgi:hypothetical protein